MQGAKTQRQSGFIQAPAFGTKIWRAREQHLPQVARAAGRPAMGQNGGLGSGSRSIRRFPSWEWLGKEARGRGRV